MLMVKMLKSWEVISEIILKSLSTPLEPYGNQTMTMMGIKVRG